MATPALSLLRSAFPDAYIAVLCRPALSAILEDLDTINEIFAFDERKFTREQSAQLKTKRFDACLLLTNSLRSAWIAWKIGCKKRIGFARSYRSFLLTDPITFDISEWQTPTRKPLSKKSYTGSPTPGFPRHMVMYYLKIAETAIHALDFSINISTLNTNYDLNLPINKKSKNAITELLNKHRLNKKILIGINPGAAHGEAKRWPAERLAHLISGIDRSDWAFVSTASRFENHLNDQVQDSTETKIYRLGEETSLRDLPALIDRLSVLITNDSGPMHIAAARQVPVVALFGPTDSASTSPWHSPHVICDAPVSCSPCFLRECPINHPCMKDIENYSVAESLLKLMRQNGTWKPL